jgi:hypothetical protein
MMERLRTLNHSLGTSEARRVRCTRPTAVAVDARNSICLVATQPSLGKTICLRKAASRQI